MPKKGSKTGYTIQCENCGKEIYQTKTQYNRAKYHFCSNKCQKEFQHKQSFEDRECEICGKLFHVSKKSLQRFCCDECQIEWQKTNTGINNVNFKGKILNCQWCNKEIVVGKSKLDRYKNHFCSEECRKKWFTNIYYQTDEYKEKSRLRAVEILKNNPPTTKTKPQIIINELLDKLNISYTNEKSIKYYSLDNYLDDYNLAIEVMGDFWHTNPTVYFDVTKEIQKKRIHKDKAKHTYVKNQYNYELLYLWENDIYNNLEVCEKLIIEYISNNGVLKNYNSFNYHILNNELLLNDEIIYPYFEKTNIQTNA